MHYLPNSNVSNFLETLQKQYAVYVPVKKGNNRYYKQYTSSLTSLAIGEVRTCEPLKAFFSRAREKVADGFKNEVPRTSDKPYAIVGVKACDLKGFKVQDFVFGSSDAPDPFYIYQRKNNLIISSDCTCAIDTCFCLALGIKPFPQNDFDINLSPVKDGFVLETGSEKGKKVLETMQRLLQDTPSSLVNKRDAQRAEVIRAVEKNIAATAIPMQEKYKDIIQKNFDNNLWQDEAKTCVECGACNTICPTCHCFLLYDQKNEKNMARFRIWDSCMIKDFARVAGGANPRAKLWMRLRNRFEKKFDFFPKVADIYACTGCGRCINACPGKIDIRKILKKLVEHV